MNEPFARGPSGHTPAGYYLIHLLNEIVQCPGDQETATKHLKQLRADAIEEHRRAYGKDPDSVPWLIGVYPPNTVGGPDGKGGVYSYGYMPTLFGHIDVPRTHWQRWKL